MNVVLLLTDQVIDKIQRVRDSHQYIFVNISKLHITSSVQLFIFQLLTEFLIHNLCMYIIYFLRKLCYLNLSSWDASSLESFVLLLSSLHVPRVCVWPSVILFWFSARSLKDCIESVMKITMTSPCKTQKNIKAWCKEKKIDFKQFIYYKQLVLGGNSTFKYVHNRLCWAPSGSRMCVYIHKI